jgi:hypothetical protein
MNSPALEDEVAGAAVLPKCKSKSKSGCRTNSQASDVSSTSRTSLIEKVGRSPGATDLRPDRRPEKHLAPIVDPAGRC